MPREAVDDLVDHLSVGPERDADEVERLRVDCGDRRAVCLVMRRLEQVPREDRELLDAALHRALVRATQRSRVGLEYQDRLPEHRQIPVPRAVDVWLADDVGLGAGDSADEERGHVRALPVREVVAENDCQFRVK